MEVILKKSAEKSKNIHQKIVFIDVNISFDFKIGLILIDLNNYIFLLKPSEIEISLSVESYDEKTDKNYQN